MRTTLALPTLCAALLAADAGAQAPPLPLTKVPGDVALFAHVKVSEIWDHPLAKVVREEAAEQIDEALAELKEELGFGFANIDTFTVYMPIFQGPGDVGNVAFIITTRKPYDKDAILKATGHDPTPDPGGFFRFDENDAPGGVFLHFPNETTFTIIADDLREAYTAAGPGLAEGPIADALKLAASGEHTAVGSANLEKLPVELIEAMPPAELRPYLSLFKSKTIVGWGSAKDVITVNARFNGSGEENARQNEEALNNLVRLAEQFLEDGREEVQRERSSDAQKEVAQAAIELALKALKTVQVSRDGSVVEASGSVKIDPGMVPKIVKVILEENPVAGAARRAQSANNLKQIGLAMHNYHDSFNGFPPAAIVDKSGKPLLSWRVAILPYIEQENLYKQFKLDEPWDSEHNIKLAETVVQVYMQPGAEGDARTKTHYRVFTGNGAVFDKLLPSRIQDIPDGTSNTIMVVEAEEAVPWSKPDSLEYDPMKPVPKLLFNEQGVCNVGFCDGSVRAIPKTIAERTLRLLITKNDGMVIPDDFDR